jgi:hypothetical protein
MCNRIRENQVVEQVYYIPIEVVLSTVCVGVCVWKALGLPLEKGRSAITKVLFVMLPLVVASIYSLCWLFIDYPVYVNTQYNYFYNQHRVMQKLMEYEGVINKDKLREAVVKQLERSSDDGKESRRQR